MQGSWGKAVIEIESTYCCCNSFEFLRTRKVCLTLSTTLKIALRRHGIMFGVFGVPITLGRIIEISVSRFKKSLCVLI
jgi:hypothetical protein